jgi:hypothetical protein
MPTARRLAVLAASALASCAARGPGAPAGAAPDPARVRAEVAWLADPARGGRGLGTPGGAEATAWIADRLREAGLAPA